MWKKILESKKAAAMLTALFVVAAGTVYKTVSFVVVKSTLLFL